MLFRSIGTNESWDLAQRVGAEILLGDTLSRVLVDDLKFDVVGQGNRLDGSGPWVSLLDCWSTQSRGQCWPRGIFTYLGGVELSKRHFAVIGSDQLCG